MGRISGGGFAGLRVRSGQDMGAGLLFIATGALGLWLSSDYSMGTPMRIGTGVFPSLLCWGLIGVGVIVAVRSLIFEGEKLTSFAWRPLILVLAAVVLFSYVIEWAGLVLTTVLICLLASFGGREGRLVETTIFGFVLGLAASLLFVYALALPLETWPTFGMWFD